MMDAAKIATPPTNNNYRKKIVSASHIKAAVAEKRRLRRIWQNKRSPESKKQFTTAQRKLRKLLEDEKDKNFINYVAQLSPNEDSNFSLWKATKYLKRPQSHVAPIRISTGGWAKSDNEKAITFANHLQKVFTPNEQAPNEEPLEISGPTNQNRIKIKHRLVRHVIKNHINVKKSPGYDYINGRMIKELPDEAIKYLTRMFNAMAYIGYFPTAWKTSIIIMIPKPGKDAQKVESYRPISLLPIFSKVFEKIILIKLTADIERLIPNHQFGFRAKHGTIEQVHRLVEEIRKVYEARGYCSALFLDVAQAFDKVWHEGLLFKINNLLPQAYHIMRSYLLERKFRVRYNQTLSPEREINAGVPQGSVLGPILYLVFTADLPTARNLMTTTFADDTAILSSHINRTIASRDLQEQIIIVEKWLQKWRIKVNETKCVHVTFTLNKNTCPQIKFNGSNVPQSNEIKYLGVHLDRRLTWKRHIETKKTQLKMRANQIHWLIGRKSKLKLEYKLLLYKSMLKPIWYYGCQVWQTASATNIEIIERVQNKLLRQITGAPWYIRNSVIHRDLGMATVKEELDKTRRKYAEKLKNHPNPLARRLGQLTVTRLKKKMLTL